MLLLIVNFMFLLLSSLIAKKFYSYPLDNQYILPEKHIGFSNSAVNIWNFLFVALISFIELYFTLTASTIIIESLIVVFTLLVNYTDFRYYLIPLEINILFLAVSIVGLFIKIYHHRVNESVILSSHLIFAFLILTALVAIKWSYIKFRNINPLGNGDLIIMASSFLLLGPVRSIFMLLTASILGIMIYLVTMLVKRKKIIIPFGPLLLSATAILFLINPFNSFF